MRLTAETDPERIRRYDHVRPARGIGARRCDAACPGIDRSCTLAHGHRGPHVAHGRWGRVRAVWDGGDAPARPGSEAVRRVAESARQGALSTGRSRSGARPARRPRPGGGAVTRWLADRFSSVEDVAMLILLLAFLGFAVDWFLRILG